MNHLLEQIAPKRYASPIHPCLPHVVAPHGGEHQEVRDEHERNGEEDDFSEA